MINQKEIIAEKISDEVVRSMGRKQLELVAWDVTYKEMLDKNWEDLYMMAEDFCPELLEEFPDFPSTLSLN